MKRVLLIAFHYPPLLESSGLHRTLTFSRYLPEFGWEPLVLTAKAHAYPHVAPEHFDLMPRGIVVKRALALDAGRHLSIGGHFLKPLSLPDRWVSWWPAAVLAGLRLIRRYRPDLIWSTYPIATAHLIALTLHRLSGISWVADFRDPMTERDPETGEEFPSDPWVRRVNGWIERPTIRYCSKAVFTTPGAAELYGARYPGAPASRMRVIANGYDEMSFREAEARPGPARSGDGRIVLLHSGAIYPSERDPRAFFGALADLRRTATITPENFKVVLRASGHDEMYRGYLKELNIQDIVALEGMVPYSQALAEMLEADGLLVLQASNCNWQIPAKLYEYLRARRPILAMTDPSGDTAKFLRKEGVGTIVPLDSREDVARGLVDFVARIRAGQASIASDAVIQRHSRKSRTRDLAALLDALSHGREHLRVVRRGSEP